ncbi:hypothetical protein DPMN_106632 [Dreissena polymorpha]|uniref:Uncharacterized protein n=1 Tax=Dreissena polymorpha TaxID=45954 RepID=A0A9D4QJ11_DREPO|nr:hypothetical protein DPMN_106632 [Dreissena polymorpha]
MNINVTSRVFICFHYIHMKKTAPPPCGYVFSPIWTIFKLVRDINKTNVFTKFHDDWAKIVTSRVFTRKTAPPTGGHVFQQTRTSPKQSVLKQIHTARLRRLVRPTLIVSSGLRLIFA